MELRSLQSPTVSCSTPRSGFFIDNPFVNGHSIKLPNNKRYPDARKLKLVNYKAQASGTTRSSSVTVEAILQDIDSNDENLVFVAGATGKVGSRTVRELLKLGCKVRAGVRSVQRGESLVKSVQQMKLDEETQPIKKLEIVECDLEKPDQIGPALGNASIVICCIGASEKEIFDVTGPYRIDYLATKNLIDAATAAKVNHFILLTSLGTNKVGFPAAILNLFWGVLIWKRKAEEVLLASGIPYTIVRPGGMERPTDSYKETHNITLSLEDTLFGGQVSNLQVAELIAFMAKNRSLSYCKVVEVIAETTAPLTPLGKLLEKIPSQRVEVYPSKEPDAADGPEPSASTEIESTQAKETTTRPLSPYTAYADLKPPTSPSPKAPGDVKDVNIVEAVSAPSDTGSDADKSESVASTTESKLPAEEILTTRPLSPYAAYEDLKPPCSPCPTPSGPKKTPVIASTLTEASDVTKVEAASVVEKDPPQAINSCLSPYPAYHDFKPPTSPSPSSPTITPASTSPKNGVSQIAATAANGAGIRI